MTHQVLVKIDKLNNLYAEQRATLDKLKEYVERELLKNRERQHELNIQRRVMVRKCRKLDAARLKRVELKQ